ncbi:MAG: DUF655 domain-containing protein [archaeon]
MIKENYAVVLDYLPQGYPGSTRRQPVVLAIGEEKFTLLELVPKPNVQISIRETTYIGPEKRDKILYIKRTLKYDELTTNAKNELLPVVEEIVKKHEQKFVDFINNAGPITIRQHTLEMLPGIGKKHLEDILREREKAPFLSFKDMTDRIPLLQNPVKIFANRIIEELKGETKYCFFVRRSEQ